MKSMMIRCLVSLLIAPLILATAFTRSRAADRPNILLIFPDQMRARAMGCMGTPDVRTPNIDRLAAEGILFRHTYANVPVCCPARAVLMTGTYPHRNGMIANDLRLRESEITLAEILAAQGYRTGFIGKWHLDGGPREPGFVPPGPRRQGFDFWAAHECQHRHFEPVYFRDTPEPIRIEKFEPEASCDFAVEFLKSQPKDRPFFLAVQMGPPHDPYGAPEKYMRLYDPGKLTLPPNWIPDSEDRRPMPPNSPYVPVGGREEIAAYYAAITAIDDQVARLVQTLKETGHDENTIILFTSDHGDMLGSHGLRRKRKPHEESAGVPGIIRWPARIPAGQVVDTLFSHVDMPPTLLGLCGLEVPAQMKGADLSRVALGETKSGPEAVLFQIFVPYNPDHISKPWRGLRTARYTYACYADGPWLLFDNEQDPWQMRNLVYEPQHAELARQLDQQLAALMKAKGDSWDFNSDALVEENGRLYRHRTFATVQEYLEWAKANPASAM
jgi:arylsulfatase A-like enzyme